MREGDLRVSCAMCKGQRSKTGGEDVSVCCLIERVRGGRVVLVSRLTCLARWRSIWRKWRTGRRLCRCVCVCIRSMRWRHWRVGYCGLRSVGRRVN